MKNNRDEHMKFSDVFDGNHNTILKANQHWEAKLKLTMSGNKKYECKTFFSELLR